MEEDIPPTLPDEKEEKTPDPVLEKEGVTKEDKEGRKGEECNYTDGGWCQIHGQGRKMFRPKKIWAQGKNGLFGWKTGKVMYFTCMNPGPIRADTPTFLMLKGGARARKKSTNSAGKSGESKPNLREHRQ